jgi:hypothetical protein
MINVIQLVFSWKWLQLYPQSFMRKNCLINHFTNQKQQQKK